MPFELGVRRNKRKSRKVIDIRQTGFAKGYISTIDNSRRPIDSLSDMTNMELIQDHVPRPRPPLVRYGVQPDKPVLGRGKYRYNNQRHLLWAMEDSGVGKLYTQKDGGLFSLIGGSYDKTGWVSCVQSKGNLYVYNGIDNLSYVKLSTSTINVYTSLGTPTISTVTKSGMIGSAYTHFYRVSANNEVGESIASVAVSVTSGKVRDAWIENTDYTDITWSAIPGARGYTVYYGNSADTLNELYTVSNATTFRDLGTLAVNPFKLAPEGDSTQGAIFNYMYVDSKNSQIFGVSNDNKLYYSAPGTGDFSPYNGGGWVGIDEDGDTTLNFVDGFRNGKGDPVITVSARGAAGKGKLFHVSFENMTVGDQVIVYPNVYEANGQSGTYAPRATIKAKDSLYYPTGQDFKSTGTSQNIVGILTTNSISVGIVRDVDRLSLSNLHKAVGIEYQDRLYFSLPVGSTENNQIWYLDTARKNAWVLRWNVSAKDMWLYEDNKGFTHFCVLVDNKVLEFTRSGAQPHQDDGVAWRSRVAFESLVWDDGGFIMGKIRKQYFKLLDPRGSITANSSGLSRKGLSTATGSDSFTVTTTPTGYDDWAYDQYEYDEDPGEVNTYGKSVAILEIKPRGLLNQSSWEVVGITAGTDYTLSAVRTKGFALDDLIMRA